MNTRMSFSCYRHVRKKLKDLVRRGIFTEWNSLSRFSTSSAKSDQVRVRFAPSPTGFLHIGGLRTALLNCLFAKSKGDGKFIIRIEDTDQTRIVPGAVENLLEKLEWVGIYPDEGPIIGGEYGPYVQSERLHLYQRYANKLLEKGSAYRCFCSQRRIDVLRRDQLRRKEHSRYDNRCRSLTNDEIEEKINSATPHVLRLRLNEGMNHFDDILNGRIEHNVANIEGDPVIMKSDGFPTYHLANVIDDHLMKITHVLRGKEWMNSTCKHVMLYEAFGWDKPKFAHLPLLNNEDGKKLSKRQGDVYVENYREKGYAPTALLNFLSHYGAGFAENTGTIFGDELASPERALKEMAQNFTLEKISAHDSVVKFWKLDEYNSTIIKHLLSSDDGKKSLTASLRGFVADKYGEQSLLHKLSSSEQERYLERVLSIRQTHISVVKDLVNDDYDYVWVRPYNIQLDQHDTKLLDFAHSIYIMCRNLKDNEMTKETVNHEVRERAKNFQLKISVAMALLRNLLIGRKQGPGVAEIMVLLGKTEALFRLQKVEEYLLKSEDKILNDR